MRLLTANGNAVLEIEDDGVAFNPLEVPEPALPESLETSPIGGLGVQLIRSSMVQCDYQRRDGRNLLILQSLITSGEAE